MTLRSLLVATDFSQDARHAAYRAAILAGEKGAQLQLLHVVSRPSLDALLEVFRLHPGGEAALVGDVQTMLTELAEAITREIGIAVNPRVAVGHVLDEILAASEHADMLLLGVRGLNPLRDLILGTTAERLLRKCRRPVLVVKRPPSSGYGKVLVPVDFSPHSATALKLAAQVASTASITVVHAFDVPFEGKLRLADVSNDEIERYRTQARRQAQARIHALIQTGDRHAQRLNDVVEQGDPRRLILAKEKQLGADLIVIGKHGSMIEDLLIGSVTRHILSDSKCDVLVDTTGVTQVAA
jgi:nucleotide-binding universal stress UspA family protein